MRTTMKGSNQRHIAIFAPVRPSPQRLRQISERASLFPQGLEMWQQDRAELGWDAGPDTAGVDQFAPFEIADQD